METHTSINLSYLAALCDGDDEFMNTIIASFVRRNARNTGSDTAEDAGRRLEGCRRVGPQNEAFGTVCWDGCYIGENPSH